MANLTECVTFSFDELVLNLETNPYPFYQELLKSEIPAIAKDNNNQDILLLSRHDHVLKILSSNNDISCDPDYLQCDNQKSFWNLFLLNTDGDQHILMRRVLSNFFSKDRMHLIEEFVKNYLPNVIKKITDTDEVDLIKNVAEELPLAVMGEIIGVRDMQQLKEIREWTIQLNPLMDSFVSKSAFSSTADSNNAMKSLVNFSSNLINLRKQKPLDDLITYIILESENKNIAIDQMLANIIFMIIASHDTTVNMIGNGILLLLKNPEELRKLANDASLSHYATEEILRYESPTQRASYRITKNIINLGNFEVPKNTPVILFLGAANRDPLVFENPNTFDVTRKNNPHLAFGHGIHNCLGKALARLEGNILFPALTEYLLKVNLKNPEPIWRKNTLFRIQEHLLVNKIIC